MIRSSMTSLVLLVLMAVPSKADPFEQSTTRCDLYDGKGLSCTTPYPPETAAEFPTLGHWARDMNATLEHFMAINGWEEGEVDLDTEIPLGARFAFTGNPNLGE